jgi:hypothetical protein
LYLGIGALVSALSGWLTLAQRFRATVRPDGKAIKGQIWYIGLVSDHFVTHMIGREEGLYLWVNPLLRFCRAALIIPWAAITGVREVKTLWWKTYALNIADITTIRVTRRAYDLLRPFLRVPSLAA